jgi:hypothetical protein
MTLLVRNEADIIAQNIAYHASLGVDHFIATDNDSSDGTREILEEFRRHGILTLVDERSSDYLQDVWATRMAMTARDEIGADWVISNDADEFWRPREGNLHDLVADCDSDGIRCSRTNMLTAFDSLPDGDWINALRFRANQQIARPPLIDIYEDNLGYPFFYFELPPKLIVRTRQLLHINRGAHQAQFRRTPEITAGTLDIFHFPIRSKTAFLNKVIRIGTAVRKNPDLEKNISWKYRRWLNFLEKGDDGQRVLSDALPDSSSLRNHLLDGLVIEDTSMKRTLKSKPFNLD